MVRILIIKRMRYGSKEINDVRVNKSIKPIAIIVDATAIWVASCLLLRKDKG